MKRGRESSADFSVIPGLPRRPEPPAELTEEQAQEWREVVGRMPSDWFRREVFPLLVQFCRHVVSARFVAKLIHDTRVELSEPETVKRLDLLLRLEEREGKAVARLATKLRLTQQSRYTPASAARRANTATPERRPWD
jgi:hypothetical protein